MTTGSSESYFAVIASLVGSSDHMAIEHPNYPSLYEVPPSLGLSHDLLQLACEQRFRPDVGRLSDLIKSNAKLVSLTRPNNPTGSVISEKALREVVELVESHSAHLVHGETYHSRD